MAYINYVVLVNFLIINISSSCSLYASLFLLFKKPLIKLQYSRTPVVFLYFCFTASSTILVLIYSGYTLILWRPDENLYNPNVLYFIAGLPTIYVNLVPVADFYLCLDRCFAFAFPFLFQNKLKLTLAVSFLLTDFLIISFYFYSTKYFSFTTKETSTTCVYYICLIWKFNYPLIMSYTKHIFCALNLIVSAILLGLNFLRKSTHLTNKLNKPVIIISLINIIFAFAPGVLLDLLVVIIGTGTPFTEYIGDTNLTCISISIALSVHFYFRVFKKHFLKETPLSKVVSVTAT